MNANQLLHLAAEHHRAGGLELAEQICRQVLTAEPQNLAAMHQLAAIAGQSGRIDLAIELLNTVTQRDPNNVHAFAHLGVALAQSARYSEAAVALQRAIALDPRFVDAHLNLAKVYRAQNRFDEAIAAFRATVALAPTHFSAWAQLANVLQQQGQLEESVAAYERAVQLRPDMEIYWGNLGVALVDLKRFDQAIVAYHRALAINPNSASVATNLANAVSLKGDQEASVPLYAKAIAIDPTYADAWFNQGNTLYKLRRRDEAMASYRKAIELNPAHADAMFNLGNALHDEARTTEGMKLYDAAVALRPDEPNYAGNRLFALHYLPDVDPHQILEEHRAWDRRYAAPLAGEIRPHENDRTPNRRPRIGYFSPDFRRHPVGRYMLPIFEHHDREQFDVFLYAHKIGHDEITDRIRAQASTWRDVTSQTDREVAETIRKDRIDVLIDLAGHTAGGRPLVFARKPAPVQASYMGYANTTGLSTMDYRLTDVYLDPPGQFDDLYSEKSVRLPETYWSYRPAEEAPPVAESAVKRVGYVTLSCLNSFFKVTPHALTSWARIMRRLPNSRLVLNAPPGTHRQRVLGAFENVDPSRIEFVNGLAMDEYLSLYHRIDIALDPFPFTGYTTSFDALWMGVPIVSLAGGSAAWRGGVSILSNIGLSNLVANDLKTYEELAVELANDVDRLTSLRHELRARMAASTQMNAGPLTRHIESAYRMMWRRWCEKGS